MKCPASLSYKINGSTCGNYSVPHMSPWLLIVFDSCLCSALIFVKLEAEQSYRHQWYGKTPSPITLYSMSQLHWKWGCKNIDRFKVRREKIQRKRKAGLQTGVCVWLRLGWLKRDGQIRHLTTKKNSGTRREKTWRIMGSSNLTLKIPMCEKIEKTQTKGEMGKGISTCCTNIITSKSGNSHARHSLDTNSIGALCPSVTLTWIKTLLAAFICFVTMVLEDVNTI